jgi:AraC family transcriptional regulator
MRISVLRDEKVVPLLPGNPVQSSYHSASGGLIVEMHRIGAIEVPDHEHASLCLHMQISHPATLEWWSENRHGREVHGPGTLMLIAPGTRDRLLWRGSSRRIVVSVDESLLARAAQELGKTSLPGLRTQWNLQDLQLRNLLAEMRREMESGWATGTLYADHLAMLLSVALVQKYSALSITNPIRGGISRSRLNRVLEFIAANTHRNLKLDDLAQVAGMSRFHFARLFHQAMGVAPYRYLLNQRIHQAEALLRLNTRTINQVASETGFASAGQFARAFKRQTGTSPSEWVRKY